MNNLTFSKKNLSIKTTWSSLIFIIVINAFCIVFPWVISQVTESTEILYFAIGGMMVFALVFNILFCFVLIAEWIIQKYYDLEQARIEAGYAEENDVYEEADVDTEGLLETESEEPEETTDQPTLNL